MTYLYIIDHMVCDKLFVPVYTVPLAISDARVSIEWVKKLCIDFSNNQKLRYAKYHIYGQCKIELSLISLISMRYSYRYRKGTYQYCKVYIATDKDM